MDEEAAMTLDLAALEEDLLCEDGLMLDMDVEEVQHSLLNGKDQAGDATMDIADMEFFDDGPLPPLDFIENDADLAALMANDDLSTPPPAATAQASLENLAHCMRQSEMALRQQQSILAKAVAAAKNQPEQHKAFAKANPFFTGRRFTITPELEKSRQEVWSIIQSQKPVWQQNPPTTAAA